MHFGLESFGAPFMYFGAIVAFLLSIFWKPAVGLYFLVPLLPMQTARYQLHSYFLGEKLIDFLLLGVVIGLWIHSPRPIFVKSALNKVLLVFSVLLYISLWQGSLFMDQPLPLSISDARFSDWKNYVEMMFLFFIVAATIRTPKQTKVLVALMCLSVLVVNRSYYNTVRYRDFSSFSDELRIAGALGYAGENGMGAFQAEFAVFLIAMAGYAQQFVKKLAILAVAGTCIYCLVFTFSRGGYLGFLSGLLVLGLTRDRKLLLILLIVLVGWQGMVPNAVRERVLMTYAEGQGLDSSAEERVTIWNDALQVILHNPLFGTGFDTYKFMSRVSDYKDTHNYYLKLLLECGFLGLFVFFMLLRTACRMSFQLFKASKDPFLTSLGCAFLAMSSCAVVVNFFGDRWTFVQVNAFFWVLFGCVARGLIVQDNHSRNGLPHFEPLADQNDRTIGTLPLGVEV